MAPALGEAITPKVKPLSLKTTKTSSSEILTTNLRLKDVALGVFTPRMAINRKWVKDLAEDIKNNRRPGLARTILINRDEPPINNYDAS